jgi:hypothetical protein
MNESHDSCCTFDCKYQAYGYECTGVPNGVCNGIEDRCVEPGQCGNGIPGEVSIVDGTPMREQCDLGEMNTDTQNQNSCCSTKCTIFDGDFICNVPSTTCQMPQKCGDASRTQKIPGTCPEPVPTSNVCFEGCQFGTCRNGQCSGVPVCSVTLIRQRAGKIPRFAAVCNVVDPAPGVKVEGEGMCDIQPGVALESLLSPFGVDLVTGATSPGAQGRRRAAVTLSGKCKTLAADVRRDCGAEADHDVFLCAQQRIVANQKPTSCPPSPCYRALVSLGHGCPKALGKRSDTLEADLVAEITGIRIKDQDGTQHLAQRTMCRGTGRPCKQRQNANSAPINGAGSAVTP